MVVDSLPTPPAPPPPGVVAVSAPSAPSRAPEASPVEFRASTRSVDVDGDGLLDRVRALPSIVSPTGEAPIRATDDPVVVAQRLADGRFAVDSAVTRAVLRAACPSMPYEPPPSGDVLEDEVWRLTGLFWAGFCTRAWGAPIDAAERAVRAFATTRAAGSCTPGEVDAAIRSVRAAVLPLSLTPIAPTPLRGSPQAPDSPDGTAAVEPSREPPDPRCASVDARNQAQARSAHQRAAEHYRAHSLFGDPPSVALEPRLQCLATSAGTWSLRAGAARFFVAGGEPTVSTTFALTWAPTAGPEASLRTPLVGESRGRDGVLPIIESAFDWDDDGAPEVAVREDRWRTEAWAERPLHVFTVRDGAARPFALASAPAPCQAVADADADGRPDLVLRSPWRAMASAGQERPPADGPTLLLHSLRGGAFTPRDDVARAWVARQCARAERLRDERALDVVDIACARALGQPPEETVAAAFEVWRAVRRRNPSEAADDEVRLSFRAIAATAAVAAPFEPLGEGPPPSPTAAPRR